VLRVDCHEFVVHQVQQLQIEVQTRPNTPSS
jgi:hypothetical protein